MDFARLDAALDSYYPQMERDLLTLISLPSVQGEGFQLAPFGPQVREALDFTLGVAATLGLRTADLDGYVGLADLEGAGPEQVGVLCHLDVVPARAEEWTVCPPFEPVVRQGRIYGRGALDDKGPTIAALYAAAVLGDFGIPLSKTVRFILGCNEESGMECVKYFREHCPAPGCGFAPDGRFPLVMGEKGICHFRLEAAWEDEALTGAALHSLSAGTAPNIVPAQAEALFSGGATLSYSGEEGVSLSRRDGFLVVAAQGKAAHGSLPQQGDNALVKLVRFLAKQDFQPRGAQAFLRAIAARTQDEFAGAGWGLAGGDKYSELTCSPNLLQVDRSGGCIGCDCRFPVTRRVEDYLPLLQAVAQQEGWRLELGSRHQPLFADPEAPLAQALLQAYRQVSGDYGPPLVMGVGTYAKAFDNFLAFGPEAAASPGLAHQADEYFTVEDMLRCAKIYCRAIYELAK